MAWRQREILSGFHCQPSKEMCVAAAKTNLKPDPVRSTKLDYCAGQDVEGADALWQGYADHDISSTDERPNAGADRPIKARHQEFARGRHHAREVKARVMRPAGTAAACPRRVQVQRAYSRPITGSYRTDRTRANSG